MTVVVYSSTRIEPVSRGGDPGRGLAATVEDPFWMLGRQRQFGELEGLDVGSPVQVAFSQISTRIDGWQADGGAVQPYTPERDILEALVGAEASGPTHSALDRLQAGRMLAAAVGSSIGDTLRAAFPVTPEVGASRAVVRSATRYADGLAVAASVVGAGSDEKLALALHLSVPDAVAARDDLRAFARWCAVAFGNGPATWVPERFERRFSLAAGGTTVATTRSHRAERIDWHDLDSAVVDPPGIVTNLRRIPTAIQFPGQPRARFFEFEDAALSLARIDATTTDLARLALVEFSTIYRNDWFTFPIPVTYGSLQTVRDLVVLDTFGIHELIAPASDSSWAMYGSPTLVVPAVATGILAGDVVEEVDFLRDELANLVWAVERVATDSNGVVRDLVEEAKFAAQSPDAAQANAAVSYRLMTDVPDNWVPFIPVVVTSEPRRIGLVEAVLSRPAGFGELVTSSPRSSVLQELRGKILPEEEVPSAGVIVRRRWFLARAADGGRHVWATRTALTGRGEGASGLQFDVANEARGG